MYNTEVDVCLLGCVLHPACTCFFFMSAMAGAGHYLIGIHENAQSVSAGE
jgi:hypothetical protein